MDDDQGLLRDLAQDLDAAFDALVIAHQDRCFSIALRVLGDRGAAEEAAQDALVRAYRALAGYDASGSASCGCDRGSRRSCSTCAGRERLAARLAAPHPVVRRQGVAAARAGRRRSVGLAVGDDRATRRARSMGGSARGPFRPPTERRSCYATSTASHIPTWRWRSGVPRAPSRRRSIEAWPSCERRSRPPSDSITRR